VLTGQGKGILCFYIAQVEQFDEPQVAQELPLPLIAAGIPSALVVTQQILESTRPAFAWHLGHSASSSARLKGRSSSNFSLQSVQTYSYIGIFLSPIISLSVHGS